MEKDLLDYEYTRIEYTDNGKISTTKKVREYNRKDSINLLIDNIEGRIELPVFVKLAFEINYALKEPVKHE